MPPQRETFLRTYPLRLDPACSQSGPTLSAVGPLFFCRTLGQPYCFGSGVPACSSCTSVNSGVCHRVEPFGVRKVFLLNHVYDCREVLILQFSLGNDYVSLTANLLADVVPLFADHRTD